MLSEYKHLFKLYRRIKDYEIIVILALAIIAAIGFYMGSRLSNLKAQNSSLNDELQKVKDNVLFMKETESRITLLASDIANLKSENNSLKQEVSVNRQNVVPIPQVDDLLKSQNEKFKSENEDLRSKNSKISAKIMNLEKQNADLKKEVERLRSGEVKQEEVKSDNDVLLSENNRLISENSRLREQVATLQLTLVRVFKEPGSEPNSKESSAISGL